MIYGADRAATHPVWPYISRALAVIFLPNHPPWRVAAIHLTDGPRPRRDPIPHWRFTPPVAAYFGLQIGNAEKIAASRPYAGAGLPEGGTGGVAAKSRIRAKIDAARGHYTADQIRDAAALLDQMAGPFAEMLALAGEYLKPGEYAAALADVVGSRRLPRIDDFTDYDLPVRVTRADVTVRCGKGFDHNTETSAV